MEGMKDGEVELEVAMEEHAAARLEEAAARMELQTQRRRAFVSALKRGEYPQAHHVLRREASDGYKEGFCCLGVACDVAIKDGLELDVQIVVSRYTYGIAGIGGDMSQTRLPTAVMMWYGFGVADPMLKVPQRLVDVNERVAAMWHEGFEAVASSLNDDYRLTLPQIGECFQYTFLRDEWEAEYGTAVSE
jgi:hypothetical protein